MTTISAIIADATELKERLENEQELGQRDKELIVQQIDAAKQRISEALKALDELRVAIIQSFDERGGVLNFSVHGEQPAMKQAAE